MQAYRAIGTDCRMKSLPLISLGLGFGVAGAFLSEQIKGIRMRRLLNGNERWMNKNELRLASVLVDQGRAHFFKGWPRPGINDQQKRAVMKTLSDSVQQCSTAHEVERLRCLQPPVAACHAKVIETHGDKREDPFYWLRDDKRQAKPVLSHLTAENAYTRAVMADTEALQEALFVEMKGRIQEADQSVPVRHGPYYYYTKTLEGQQYKIHCRRKVPDGHGPATELEAMDESLPEETLLDENTRKVEGGHTFYMVGCVEPSTDHRFLAWSEDTTGNERYTLRVKDLSTGKEMMRPILLTSGEVEWSADNQYLFYITKDHQERPCKVWRHQVGQQGSDVMVFEEPDEAFFVGIGKSRSEEIIFIECGSAVTSESLYIHADKPLSDFTVILPRVNDVQYEVRHRGAYLYIVLRDKARPNSEVLMAKLADLKATCGSAAAPTMEVLLAHSQDIKLDGITVSANFLVVFKRVGGLQQASVHKLPQGSAPPVSLQEGGVDIVFDEPAYSLDAGPQGDFESPVVRLEYTSLTTPNSTIDFNMGTGARCVKKVQPVLGGFKKEDYLTERQWAVSQDGTRVPISIAYKKGAVKLDGTDPLLLNGYGSYEMSNDPWFNANRLCLLDRGFIFAMAHIRGGGEMGRAWYEDGKYLKKMNTFLDFIACAEFLVKENYTSPQRLSIEGRSAGGLLIGAVCNMKPDLFHAAILGVPFVDALTTMLDETIPLTVIEYEEWGNPNTKEYYEYMKSYSPMDNVRSGVCYPHMLVTGGLHDPRVGYWEPAKLVAHLRRAAKPANLLLLKMELGAGHFSVTGRFERLKEVAFEYAFLLKCSSMPEAPLASE